jgi:hypothetical protein
MNDDLMTAVRESFAPVRMDTPPATIMGRGRAMRRRRHGGAVAAGALAVALGAGLAVPALTTASGSAGGAGKATLTAWTVDRKPGGSIAVTIRELRDLPALQRELASYGARITISADKLLTLPRSCLSPDSGNASGNRAFQLSPVVAPTNNASKGLYFTLYPDRMPPGQVLRITVYAYGHIPFDPVAAGKAGKTITTLPGALGLLGEPYDVFLTLVLNTPPCTS